MIFILGAALLLSATAQLCIDLGKAAVLLTWNLIKLWFYTIALILVALVWLFGAVMVIVVEFLERERKKETTDV